MCGAKGIGCWGVSGCKGELGWMRGAEKEGVIEYHGREPVGGRWADNVRNVWEEVVEVG